MYNVLIYERPRIKIRVRFARSRRRGSVILAGTICLTRCLSRHLIKDTNIYASLEKPASDSRIDVKRLLLRHGETEI